MPRASLVLSVACLALAALFYLGSVTGMLWKEATPPLDNGVVAVTSVFLLFGLVGLLLGRGRPRDA